MADQKISELSEANSVASADLFPIVSQGTNKKVTFASMMANVGVDVVINVANSPSVSFAVNGGSGSETNMLVVNPAAGSSKVCIAASSGSALAGERLYVNGNATIDNGSLHLQSIDLNATGTDGTQVSLATAVTVFTNASNVSFNMADGQDGQVKVLVNKGAGPKTVNAAAGNLGFASVGLEQGESATCIFADGDWYLVNHSGVTIA